MHKLARTILTRKKREATLRAVINQNASEYQLLKAAGKLRDARIQVLRARIGEMPLVIRTPDQDIRVEKLSRQIESLVNTPPDAILAEFRKRR